jgi:phage terminase Nu1 subunit (DNA packaging protein)
MDTATIHQVAKALNIHSRRVHQLVAEGMPQIARGQYSIGACALWYIRFLQRALTARASDTDGDGSITTLRHERIRQAAARSVQMEMRNAKEAGELIVQKDFAPRLLQCSLIVRNGLDALPSRLNLDEATTRRVDEECTLLRNAFADGIQALIAKDQRKRVAALKRGKR